MSTAGRQNKPFYEQNLSKPSRLAGKPVVASPNVGCFPQAILAVGLVNCDLFPVFFK